MIDLVTFDVSVIVFLNLFVWDYIYGLLVMMFGYALDTGFSSHWVFSPGSWL